MPSDPPVRYLGIRSARANAIWSAPATRPDLLALRGLSLLYSGVVGAKRRAYESGLVRPERVGVPVISIGNLVVGGTGKTPFTRWVADYLRGLGSAPAILHGGYGLDEPELHRRWNPGVPIVVNRDRIAGARTAQSEGATVVLLDDGLQHLRIARDLDLVLVAADSWTESQRLLPAGPWREPIEALPAGAIVIVTHKAAPLHRAHEVAAAIRKRKPGTLVITSHLHIDAVEPAGTAQPDQEGSVVAVCAIGDPLAFGRQLQQRGMLVDEVLAYDDHHEYTVTDAAELRQLAGNRRVVTTEKDAVKLERVAGQLHFWVARQTVSLGAGRSELESALAAVVR